MVPGGYIVPAVGQGNGGITCLAVYQIIKNMLYCLLAAKPKGLGYVIVKFHQFSCNIAG